MNLKRKIKIFWVEHGDPILLSIILIAGVIIIVQGLNYMAVKRKKETNNNINNITEENVEIEKKTNENKQLIERFIQYCDDGNIEDAYDLLSENCKIDLYPTKEEFINKYYEKMFNDKRDTEVEYIPEEDIYKIKFYDSILESGKVEGRNYISNECKIEKEVLESKIYISINDN